MDRAELVLHRRRHMNGCVGAGMSTPHAGERRDTFIEDHLRFRLLSGTPLNQFLRISLRRERSFFTNANFPTQLALLPVHRKAERTRVAPRLLPPYSATPSSRRERVSLRPGIRPSLCSSLHANSYTRYLLSIYRYSLHGGLELAGA